jgi:regulator of sigma E protease
VGSLVLMDVMFLDSLNLISSSIGWLSNGPGWNELATNLFDASLVLGETPYIQRLMGTVINILQVALGLGFVIFVHELGHFLAAKTFGVRCDKFYVGFDVPISIGPIKLPRTLGKFTWGETEYGLGIIPLGGYVKMLGQDDDPRKAEAEAERIRQGEGEAAPLDPRSYPAKPVWQRMIIISAGVVMNLIFAVIMAAVAYWYGVPYDPAVVGGTVAGGPAWEAGLQPGDQIVRIGSMKNDDPHLRYEDFAGGIAIQGLEAPDQPLTLSILRGGQRLELDVQPTKNLARDSFLRVGAPGQTSPIIGRPAFEAGSFLAQSAPDLQPGDVIVAVNGERLPVDPRYDAVLGSSLTSQFQRFWEQDVTVTVERAGKEKNASPQTLDVVLPAVPAKTLGIGFATGPITALQRDSIAKRAGLQVGDVIETINGQAVENALELPTLIARLYGQEVTLRVRRPLTAAEAQAANASQGDRSETVEITFSNTAEPSFDPISASAGRLSLAGIGASIEVLPKIATADNSLIASGDVRPGDELVQYHWIVTNAERQELSNRFTNLAFEPQRIDPLNNAASFYDLLQKIPVGSKLKLYLLRDGKTREAIVEVKYAENWFWHQRGISISPFRQIHQTDSLATAVQLGFWETKRRFFEVLNFLRLLVTGKIGANGFGGPLMIAQVASSEASKGVSALLIFLTMLSANLAILNFLPIPALDGGHMMFLTAEAIRGKPLSEALQIRLTMVGVLGLLSLMAFVIVKDILMYLS